MIHPGRLVTDTDESVLVMAIDGFVTSNGFGDRGSTDVSVQAVC
jgi:hypothetical protein